MQKATQFHSTTILPFSTRLMFLLLVLTKATFLVLEMLFKIEALASHEYIAHNHFIMDVVELHHVSVNSKP